MQLVRISVLRKGPAVGDRDNHLRLNFRRSGLASKSSGLREDRGTIGGISRAVQSGKPKHLPMLSRGIICGLGSERAEVQTIFREEAVKQRKLNFDEFNFG